MPTRGDAIASIASDGWCGPANNIGLSPERTQALYQEAKERIAAENKAKEEAKARKAAKKGKLPDGGNGDDDYKQHQAGDPIARGEEDNKGPFGWIKALRKNH